MANLRGVGTRLSGSAGDWTYTENGGASVAKQNNLTLCPAMIVNFFGGRFFKKCGDATCFELVETCQDLSKTCRTWRFSAPKLVETCFFGLARFFSVILHLEIESLTPHFGNLCNLPSNN
mgnify:CR=1 FL=1